MEMSWEAWGGIVGIITVIYLVYQFHYLPRRDKKRAQVQAAIEEQKSLDHIRILWNASKAKLEKLITNLTNYCNQNDCRTQYFQPNITFDAQLRQLNNLMESDFKPEYYQAIDQFSISKDIMGSAVINIQKQIDAFTQMQAYFDGAFRFR